MQIKTKDKIVQQVLKKMDERSLIGQKKYGAYNACNEIERSRKDLNTTFLVDVQEELMDALLYIEAAKRCLKMNRRSRLKIHADVIYNDEKSFIKEKRSVHQRNTMTVLSSRQD